MPSAAARAPASERPGFVEATSKGGEGDVGGAGGEVESEQSELDAVGFVVMAENEMEVAAGAGEQAGGVGLTHPLGLEPFQRRVLIEPRWVFQVRHHAPRSANQDRADVRITPFADATHLHLAARAGVLGNQPQTTSKLSCIAPSSAILAKQGRQRGGPQQADAGYSPKPFGGLGLLLNQSQFGLDRRYLPVKVPHDLYLRIDQA